MSRKRHECEIVVVGAGPAGMAAACTAAEAGKQVALLDHSPELGGQVWRGEQAHPTRVAAKRWLARLEQSGARVFSNTAVFDVPSPHSLLAETPQGACEISWQKLILATGARERLIPFPGWTLPGVLGPGGLHALAKAGWPVKGKRVIVAGSGPLLLAVADGLKQHGAQVLLIAEQTPWSRFLRFGLGLWRHPGKLVQGAFVKSRILTVPHRCGCWLLRAEGADSVQRVTITDGSRTWNEACDLLACGFGFVPNVELAMLLGCELSGGFVQVNDFQETTVADVLCAGEPTGIGGENCALTEGQIAGCAAAGRTEQARVWFGRRASWHRFRTELCTAFAPRPELRRLALPDTVICRCEDVRRGQVDPFTSWREAKLHTRCGMGTCQGRTCGAATEFLFDWRKERVRSPIFPVYLESIVPSDGRHACRE
ncbi:MAG: FAD/NAD(P)-binding oxidoreductase [bacterium]